ncbi:MAG: glutathione S-transferase family protein [Gammaproteobacteria bacterium]|jgi:glutathione S-transferase|nr:glutathione S-transferase family protein [Gammaproteobacteria bacterium]MDP6537546.1 glutathione S-transferase family protein [Gammaproteobacteria bacterium]MDP6731528.1 glutathione S-transferase family protein [Gammaproteobacteria bacterium]HAJ76588.1 glutathione S-transferase [Gammaproteobacteria bacterium]|tara:strand:+ start:312 stop:923 length:612 start_codon:yes stop_codon:yes gene_type:complete
MKLYDLPPSPNARRVRIFIAEKGLDIPLVPVNMMTGENKSEEYLAKNPLGKMPLLELDDGTCIAESAAICRYLEEMNPEPPLLGRDAVDRALVDMWHRRMEFELLIPMITIFVHTGEMWKDRVTQIPELVEVTTKNVQASMEWLNQELEGKEFIAGEDYTVADIAAQCAFVMGKAALGIRIPEGLNELNDWWARVSARPTARA